MCDVSEMLEMLWRNYLREENEIRERMRSGIDALLNELADDELEIEEEE
jgi:hypothetical protein